MKDIEAYRHILKQNAIMDYTLSVCKFVGTGIDKARVEDTVMPAINTVIQKIKEIDNADFQENTNPDHGREQGAPF